MRRLLELVSKGKRRERKGEERKKGGEREKRESEKATKRERDKGMK